MTICSMIIFSTSCEKATPARFWNTYHKDEISNQENDQGPWGGHRNIIWKSETVNSFDSKEIIDFAIKNKWTFIDSIYISTDTLETYTATESINNEYDEDILRINVLPKWNGQKVKVLKFKTGWVAIEPGDAKQTEINGFAILNLTGTELNIYHKWGE